MQESLLKLGGANDTARSDDAAQLKDLRITGTQTAPLVAICSILSIANEKDDQPQR